MISRLRKSIRDLGGLSRVWKLTIRNPKRTWRSLRRVLGHHPLAGIVARSERKIYTDELRSSGLIPRLGDRLMDTVEDSGVMRVPHLEAIYVYIRSCRPDRVVETGVCNGLSSAVILAALHRNGSGRLISVDFPEFAGQPRPDDMWEGKGGAAIPNGKSPGWIIPHEYRDRWQLQIGKSQDLLPDILQEKLDLFISDGEHSYDAQFMEFSQAWRALRGGGVLMLTDINSSAAFEDARRTVFDNASIIRYVDHSAAIVRAPL